MINNQVTNISNTLADFRDDYNSDQKYLNDAIMHKKYLLINTDATSWKICMAMDQLMTSLMLKEERLHGGQKIGSVAEFITK